MKPSSSRAVQTVAQLFAVGILLGGALPAAAVADDLSALMTLAGQKRTYDSHLASTQALLDALAREGGQPDVDATLRKSRARLAEAGSMARDNYYEAARSLVDAAQADIRTTLVHVKSRPSTAESTAAKADGADGGATDLRERELARREIETTRALIDALRREPTVNGDIEPLNRDVGAAAMLLDAGKPTDALHLVDRTYARAKAILSRVKKSGTRLSGSASLDAELRAKANATDTPELRSRFTRREDSVASLQQALQRISEGKEQYRPLLADGEKMLGDARRQGTAGQYPDGIALLDRAYLLLKAGIGELRGGTEQTASKYFATPAEEYRYEQGRNDDYAQLIDSLLAGAKPHADWAAVAKRARVERERAESAVRTGDWKAALKHIGDSTRELKKVLRSAGFPIV